MSIRALSLLPEQLAQQSLHIRRTVLEMAYRSRSGHVGSSFSCVDLLVSLYGQYLQVDPLDPRHPDRDRFILSKGHAASALYAVLAERGFFERDVLLQYLADGSFLAGHPSPATPGVDAATGSLGHGLGIGAGMALAAQMNGQTYRTVVLVSDGECNEGSTWEAALFAAHHHLKNLICIVDCNGIQGFGRTEDVLRMEPFADKWRAFGWTVYEVDGHDHATIQSTLRHAADTASGPQLLLAHTVKGKGVSFMENTVDWHYWTMNEEHYRIASAELQNAALSPLIHA